MCAGKCLERPGEVCVCVLNMSVTCSHAWHMRESDSGAKASRRHCFDRRFRAECRLQNADCVECIGGQNVQIAKCRLQNADCTIAEGGGGGGNLAIKGRRLWKPVEGVGEGTAECRFTRPIQIFVRESDCRL